MRKTCMVDDLLTLTYAGKSYVDTATPAVERLAGGVKLLGWL